MRHIATTVDGTEVIEITTRAYTLLQSLAQTGGGNLQVALGDAVKRAANGWLDEHPETRQPVHLEPCPHAEDGEAPTGLRTHTLEIRVERVPGPEDSEDPTDFYQVVCCTCGMSGPQRIKRRDAIDDWNRVVRSEA